MDFNRQTVSSVEREQEAELRQYIRIAWRWSWFVLVCTLAAAGVGFGVSTILPPIYRASTSLLVRADPSTIFASTQLAATYKELLTNRPVIEAAAGTLGLDARQVEAQVQVNIIPDTSLIELTAEANDPHLAVELANGVVAAFMRIARESGSVRTRDLIVVETATLPLKPVSPQKLLNTLIAAMLGFLLATGSAFLFEYLDDSLKTVEDIRQSLSLPTLTVVPRPKRHRKRGKATMVIDDPDSPLTEAYRVLRTRLQFFHSGSNLRTILMTTPLSPTETAAVMTNLGVVMAQTGLNVLLVDANLHKPQLHQFLGVPQGVGLSTLLMETGDYQSGIVETGIRNLRLLSGGPAVPDLLQLLSSSRMTWLLTMLKQQADIILINTPPILIAADALVLAVQVDATVLVIESRSTLRRSAAQALTMLHNVEANVLGAVLTKVRTKASGYHYYADFSKTGTSSQVPPLLYRSRDGTEPTEGAILSLPQPVSESLDSSDRGLNEPDRNMAVNHQRAVAPIR